MQMLKKLQFGAAIALLMIVSPAWTQEKADKDKADRSSLSDAGGAPQKPSAADSNYVIGGQDVLDISVWKEAELTRVVPVRPDGKISLPLLNDVQAAGLTPTQLAAQLTD